MQNNIYIMLVVVLITLCHPASAGEVFKLEKQEKGMDVWIKLDKLSEVEELLAKKDVGQARIVLNSFLERYPDDTEARELAGRLESAGRSAGTGVMDEKRQKADTANKLWMEYQRLKEARYYTPARARLLEIRDLYGGVLAVPDFLPEYGRELSDVEGKIEKLLASEFTRIRNELAEAAKIEDSEKKLAEVIRLYGELRSATSENKGLPAAVLLLNEVLKEQDRAARIMFAKATTLKDLDGCDVAIPVFEKLRDILTYRDLDFYQRTERELRSCEE